MSLLMYELFSFQNTSKIKQLKYTKVARTYNRYNIRLIYKGRQTSVFISQTTFFSLCFLLNNLAH